MTFISCPAKFWSLFPSHTWTTQVFGIQYSQGFPRPLISLPALLPVGKEGTPGLKRCPLLGFSVVDWRLCLEPRSIYCFTSFKGTSPRHGLLSLTAVRWASLSFTFLPQKVFAFSSVDCLVTQKDRKMVPFKHETSQSLSLTLGAWIGEAWYSSSSSSFWARTKNKASYKHTQDKTWPSSFALKEYKGYQSWLTPRFVSL